MKKFIALTAAVAIVAVAGIAGAKKKSSVGSADMATSVSKFGYIDLNKALNGVNEGKTAKAKLEADGKAKKQKLEILQKDLKKMKDEIDKQRLILSAEALRAKEMQLQHKFMELQKKTVNFERDFAEKETNYIKPISEKLQRVIIKIGQDKGYTLIVPKEMALYSLPGTDVTQDVIATYNKMK